MIKELLELLVCIVDAQLLKGVETKDLKAGNVEDANEGGRLPLGAIEASVDAMDEPLEHALVAGLGDGLNARLDLFFGLSLRHIVSANFELRSEEGLDHVGHVESEKVAHFLGNGIVGKGCLVRVALLHELHIAKEHDGRDGPENGCQKSFR